jgi:hypothetical protein
MATQPVVNGNYYSFASIEIDVRGRKIKGFKELSYDDGLDPGMARGTSPIALAHTQGDYEANASGEMYRKDFDELVTLLGDGFGEVEFPITVTYASRGMPTVTDRLPAVRIKKADNSNSQGNDPTSVKLEFAVLSPIERNGKRLVSRDA